MTRLLLTTLASAVLLSAPLAPTASARVCDTGRAMPGESIRTPLLAGDLGVVPTACATSAVGLDVSLRLTIAVEDFYGGVAINATPRGRVAFTDRFWVSTSLIGVDYQLAVNATLNGTALGSGAMTVGAHYAMFQHDRLQIAPYIRVMLPTESWHATALRTGLELGAAFVIELHEEAGLELVGGASLPLLTTVLGGRQTHQFAPTLTVDLVWEPTPWFAAVAGLALRTVPASNEPFESLDPRLALRFFPTGGLWIQLGAALPLAGRDRTTAAAGLNVGWTFSR